MHKYGSRSNRLDPIHFLVLPRLVAAMLVMPLLAVLADIVGIFGGALVMSFWPLPILHSSIAISG